jgi:hypothetical protein
MCVDEEWIFISGFQGVTFDEKHGHPAAKMIRKICGG